MPKTQEGGGDKVAERWEGYSADMLPVACMSHAVSAPFVVMNPE